MSAPNVDEEGRCRNCGRSQWIRHVVMKENLILEEDGSIYDVIDIEFIRAEGPIECSNCGLGPEDEV